MAYHPLTKLRRTALLGSAATLLAGFAAGTGASAQDSQDSEADETLEEVLVTGTRIRRADLTATNPVTVVSGEEFALRGFNSAENLLRDLPQTQPATTSVANNGNAGIASVDLRGLGAQRTLVLVDGKRMVAFDSNGIVDLNSIPVALIERQEIVTGGASAVYGSDAVSGVVNFILKDDFEGMEFSARFGSSEGGDALEYNANLTVGGNFADGRGNAVINIDYTNRNGLFQSERPFSVAALDSFAADPNNPFGLVEDGSNTTTDGVVSGLFNINGNLVQDAQFDANGNISPYQDPFNFNPFNYLQVPNDRWTVTGLLSYDLNDSAELYGRTTFVNSTVDTILAPSGTFGIRFDTNIGDSGFFSPQAQRVLADVTNNATGVGAPDGLIDGQFDVDGDGVVDAGAVRNISVRRRTIEVGTRDSTFDNTTFQAVAGIRGEFAEGWDYDVFGQLAIVNRTQSQRNDINGTRIQQGLLTEVDANGNVVCVDQSDGCVPVNLFGPGNLSAEAADFIRLNLVNTERTSQRILGGTITGDLESAGIKSPFADNAFAVAFGFEYRDEESRTRPDQNLIDGNGTGFGATVPIDFGFDVWELYGELYAPIVENKPFAESLAVKAAFRFSDYSTIGSVETFLFGGEWAPISDIRFRGEFQRAVRAPNIFELAAPVNDSGVTGLSNDPCEGSNPVGNQELTDLCIATGVPAANIGFVNSIVSGQVGGIFGGNMDLQEETADTITIGAVVTPRAIPGLSVTVDYYDIEIEDAIDGFGGSSQQVIDGCYNVFRDPDNQFCQAIIRDPATGSLNAGPGVGIFRGNANTALIGVEGVDIGANYIWEEAFFGGSLDFNYNGAIVTSDTFQPSVLSPVIDCEGRFGNNCENPIPEYRHNLRTTWVSEDNDFSLSVLWRYIGGVEFDNPETPIIFSEIDAENYFDLTGSYLIKDNINLRFGVNNLLDNQPPIVGSDAGPTIDNNANTFPGVYDPIGRFFFTQITLTY